LVTVGQGGHEERGGVQAVVRGEFLGFFRGKVRQKTDADKSRMEGRFPERFFIDHRQVYFNRNTRLFTRAGKYAIILSRGGLFPMASFFRSLFAFLFQSNSPEALKKRALKSIEKRIKSSRFKYFYKTKSRDLCPACGKFFFEIFRVIASLKTSLDPAIHSVSLKFMIVENFLEKDVLISLDKYTPEWVVEQSKIRPPRELTDELRSHFHKVSDAIDKVMAVQIDSCYNLILALHQFVSFDYPLLLRQFGIRATERSLKDPKFTPAAGKDVVELLKDFLYVALALDSSQDWKTCFNQLRGFNSGGSMITLESWFKVLAQLGDVLHSDILNLIIRHIDRNPDWNNKILIPNEKIFSFWLNAQQSKVENMIEQIINSRVNSKIGELVRVIFGAMEIKPLEYYNDGTNEQFLLKGLEGLTQIRSFAFLSTFLQTIFVKELREFSDLIIVRAQWSSIARSPALSDQCLAVEEIKQRLKVFDESMKKDGKNGFRLFGSLAKFDTDKTLAKIVRELLAQVNAEATDILIQAVSDLSLLQISIDTIRRDFYLEPHELIANWREIEVAAGRSMSKWLKELANKLACFIQLCQLFYDSQNVVM
jgi:hypothetical protein